MQPLIAMAGEFWDGATGLGLAEGFRRAGFDVITFDARYYHSTADGDLPLRAAARLLRPRATKAYRARILADCAADRPRVFLSIKGFDIDRSVLTTLKSQGAILALFYPDVDFNHAGVDAELFDLYDFIFTTKTFHLPWLSERLKKPKIHFVQHGYSTATHVAARQPDAINGHRWDVSYVGTFSSYKMEWLLALQRLRPNLSLYVVGWGWRESARGTALEPAALGRGLEGALFRRVLSASRINLAVHFGPTASGWADKVSTRTFQIPAARGFMLHIDNDEVRQLFDVPSEIDVFSTPEDLATKIDFYLAHPEKRAAMIDAAYARTVPAYGYDARASEMAGLMGFDAKVPEGRAAAL